MMLILVLKLFLFSYFPFFWLRVLCVFRVNFGLPFVELSAYGKSHKRFITIKMDFFTRFLYVFLHRVYVCYEPQPLTHPPTQTQRVMDSAEQAAISESERDSSHHHHHQAQMQMSHRLYEMRHINDYISDDSKDLPPKPMRRFEDLVVNLTHSSVMYPAGISAGGKQCLFFVFFRCCLFFGLPFVLISCISKL